MDLPYEQKTMPMIIRKSLHKYDKAPKRHLSTALRSCSLIQGVQKCFLAQKTWKPRMEINYLQSYYNGYYKIFKWVLTYLLSLLDLAAVASDVIIHKHIFPFSKLLLVTSKLWRVLN